MSITILKMDSNKNRYLELDCCASGETAGGGRVRLQIGADEPEVPAMAPPPLLPADPTLPVPPDAMPDVPALKSGLVALARSLT